MKKQLFVILALLFTCWSCGPSENTEAAAEETSKPTITIEENNLEPKYLMVMDDEAQSMEELGTKLGTIFEKISACAQKCGMEEAGAPMGWYSGPDAPWIFTAGIPYTTKCTNPEEGISIKEVAGGKAVVVHFFGPYSLTPQGYEAGEAYLLEKKLELSGAPYEMYVGDPEKVEDPFQLQTDIIFPIK